MENLATIPPPPLPTQRISLRPSSVNRDQELGTGPRLDQDQSLQIHSEPDEIEAMEERPSGRQDDLVIKMKYELENTSRLEFRAWDKLCIYKVPYYLHEKHHSSYSPQTVWIGPYYYCKEHLQSMESHKGRAVNKVLARSGQCIEMYIDAMRELEEKARACYVGVISMSSNDFTKLLLLDGCFVLEILRGAVEGFAQLEYAPNDQVFAMRESMHLIQRDMMMLENQLPLFVLNRLLELQLGTQMQPNFAAKLATRFFYPLILRDMSLTGTEMPVVREDMLHCLDVFRQSLCLPDRHRRRSYWESTVVDKRPQHMIHCVTKLRGVGIKFRKKNTHLFWDITFENGYLEIPKLFIHEGTKSLFLNLMAFEECHIDSSNDVTSYIIFMDNLIDSAEDVSYLQNCGIIEHWLESNCEVADLFNKIGQGIVFNTKDSYLFDMSVEVQLDYDHRNKYFRKLNAWKTTLIEKYFDSPWAYISFFAALLLLVLTFLQCYFAAYGYYNPSP